MRKLSVFDHYTIKKSPFSLILSAVSQNMSRLSKVTCCFNFKYLYICNKKKVPMFVPFEVQPIL